MKIEFTEAERQVVDESFMQYMQVVGIMARLHGLTGAKLATAMLADDRSGFTVPDGGSK